MDELFEKPNVVELEEDYNYYIKGEDSFSKTGQFIPVDYVEDICAGVLVKRMKWFIFMILESVSIG